MKENPFDMDEFIENQDPETGEAEEIEDETEGEAHELDVQKAVVEELAAENVELREQMSAKEAELAAVRAELEKAKSELSAEAAKVKDLEGRLDEKFFRELDLQERNPNSLALLDRDVDIPDRFPGETRDHVLEVIREARDAAESEGRIRRAQVLESVLVANEPNGTLARKRAELERLFAENGNIVSGPVIEELKRCGLSHKNGEEYLLPSEIIKRNY